MTPAEALSHLNKGDPEGDRPDRLSQDVPGSAARPGRGDRPRWAAVPPAGRAPAGLAAKSVQALLQRAIAGPERLRTPARRRVAFLQHHAACRTLVEAAARAGVDRRTVNRWRQASPPFTALALYLLKQSDTEVRRAEDRRSVAAEGPTSAEQDEWDGDSMSHPTGHWLSPEERATSSTSPHPAPGGEVS